MQENQKITLYNMIFPIWMLILVPHSWVVILPVNYVIDAFVVKAALSFLHIEDRKKVFKSVINYVWALGFAADIIGALCMLAIILIPIESKWWYYHIQDAVSYNPLRTVYSFLLTSLCVAIAGYCIYRFNFKLFSKRTELDEGTKKKVCLALAIVTAPYLFFLPMEWFY